MVGVQDSRTGSYEIDLSNVTGEGEWIDLSLLDGQISLLTYVAGYYHLSGIVPGPVGSGQLAKMINQICIAGLVQGLAEGLHFGKLAGLYCKAVVDVS